MMNIQSTLEQKLKDGLQAHHLEVVNESGNHNVPPGSESHFKVVVVSPQFDGKNLVQRHRLVYDLLAREMAGGVHALALHTYTEADWLEQNASAPDSPECRGGKAREI